MNARSINYLDRLMGRNITTIYPGHPGLNIEEMTVIGQLHASNVEYLMAPETGGCYIEYEKDGMKMAKTLYPGVRVIHNNREFVLR